MPDDGAHYCYIQASGKFQKQNSAPVSRFAAHAALLFERS
jgi:hypothetical protein